MSGKTWSVSRHALVVIAAAFVVAPLTQRDLRAQDDQDAAQTPGVRLMQVGSEDKGARYDKSSYQVHILGLNTPKPDRHSALSSGAQGALPSLPSDTQGALSSTPIVGPDAQRFESNDFDEPPAISPPGFYPSDLSNPDNGSVLTSAESNPLYVNCLPGCWDHPSAFLRRLSRSGFIHIIDQYAGSTAHRRYKLGQGGQLSYPVSAPLNEDDLLDIVHAGARALGNKPYHNVFHVFLPKGTDVCLAGGSQCYSPDNPSTFVFCAFHGSVDFSDFGHVLFTVEPYQDVPGCSVAQPSPNGALVDSTASTLSHELIETITDPDGTAWVARNSLVAYGEEVADLCVTPFGQYGKVLVGGKHYAIQPEYSNKLHGCVVRP